MTPPDCFSPVCFMFDHAAAAAHILLRIYVHEYFSHKRNGSNSPWGLNQPSPQPDRCDARAHSIQSQSTRSFSRSPHAAPAAALTLVNKKSKTHVCPSAMPSLCRDNVVCDRYEGAVAAVVEVPLMALLAMMRLQSFSSFV